MVLIYLKTLRLAQLCQLALLFVKNALLPLLSRNNAGPRKGIRGSSLMIRSAEPLGLDRTAASPSHMRGADCWHLHWLVKIHKPISVA
jgi:hypothetical protein